MGITEEIERHNIEYEETVNQVRIPSGQGLIGASAYWEQATTPLLGVIGINNANGTEILEIEIPAGYVFVCSLIQFSCNEARTIKVCTVADAQVLGHGSQVEIFTLGSANQGLHAIKGEAQPVFVVDNSGSAVAIDMLLFAPHTVFNIINDPVTSYFEAFFAGLMYNGAIAIRGTT